MQISYNENCELVSQSLNIPDERCEELHYRMECILHELKRPLRKGEKHPSSSLLLKLFLALAENEQELAYVSYSAAIEAVKYFGYNEIDEDFFEDEMPGT